MPTVGYNMLRRIALEQGASQRQSKQYAAHIVSAPWFPTVVETLTLPRVLTYPDPVGEEAVHNILHAALMRTTANELETTR